MNKINYQKELEKIIEYHERKKEVPTLLLHACCAPCSSYVLEYLSKYFKIDILFYNPNIETGEEYRHRAEELVRLISEMEFEHPVTPIIEQYEPEKFYKHVEGLEQCREGGNRCFKCYELRLTETAMIAAEKHYGVKYLYSDFKKKNGYKRSIELSREYQLYRQNFCGCKFSKRQNSGDIELKPSE